MFCIPMRLCPSSPTPFSHKGLKGGEVSGSGHGMPCPDVAAASRYAAPRRRCRNAVCRAPTSLPQRGMPRPDVAAASASRARALTALHQVSCAVYSISQIP